MGDKVLLKVFPWKKVFRFRRIGKLTPTFIGLHKILERTGPVAYRLALPPKLEKVHNIFHILMLRRYLSDPLHVLTHEEIELRVDLSYEEEPISILAKEIKELRNKLVPLVKFYGKTCYWRGLLGDRRGYAKVISLFVQFR